MSTATMSPTGTTPVDRAERVEATSKHLVTLFERIKCAAKRLLGFLKRSLDKVKSVTVLKFRSMRARRRAALRRGGTNTTFVADEVAEVKEKAQTSWEETKHAEQQDVLNELRHNIEPLVSVPLPPVEIVVDDPAAKKLVSDAKNMVRTLEAWKANMTFDPTNKVELQLARQDAVIPGFVEMNYRDTQALWSSITSSDTTYQLLEGTDYAVRLEEMVAWVANLHRIICTPKPQQRSKPKRKR